MRPGDVDGDLDPLEADGEGDEGFVCGRGVAIAHTAEGVGGGAVSEAEVSSGFFQSLALGDECERKISGPAFLTLHSQVSVVR